MSMILKVIFILVVIVIIAGACIVTAVIVSNKNKPDKPTDTEPASSQQDDKKYNRIDDIYQAGVWLGKTKDEINVPDDYITEESITTVINFEGKLFGVEAYGTAYFDRDTLCVDSVYVIVDNSRMSELYEKLNKKYGEPCSDYEEPYVESLGGAVRKIQYKTDNWDLLITSGSNNNYTMLQFSVPKAK